MDRNSYEKLSIVKESSNALKKYGSTSRQTSLRNETNSMKHFVTNTDTLQGIALKYNVTIEQIRRINKLWASDSLFLREYLLIPLPDNVDVSQLSSSSSTTDLQSPVTPISMPSSSSSTVLSRGSFDDDNNIFEFLNKIDASIASTKEEVEKTARHSGYADPDTVYHADRRKPVARMKQIMNNNSNEQHTVVVHQGKKVRNSMEHHEHQQEQLFEL